MKKDKGHVSYTFLIIDDEGFKNGKLQNLVIDKKKDSLKAFLFSYHNTEGGIFPSGYDNRSNLVIEHLVDINMNDIFNFLKVDIVNHDEPNNPGGDEEPGSGSNVYCYMVETYNWHACSGTLATGTHTDPSECYCEDTLNCKLPYFGFASSDLYCTSDANINSAGNTYLYENYSNGAGGDNTTSYEIVNNEIIISSIVENILPDGADPLAFKLGLNTASTLYSWFVHDDQEQVYKEIGVFLEQNSFSQQAKNVAVAAINVLMDDSELSLMEIVRILRDMDKKCQSDIIYNALFVNSSFNITFFDALIKPVDKHIAFRDLPNSNNVDEVPVGALANTQPNRGYDPQVGDFTIIDFSDNFLDNTTDLGIAVVLYHEMVHAYLIHLYHERKLLAKFPNYTELNSSMNNYFQNPTASNLNLLNKKMHDVMKEFIDLMAESVYQWSLDNNVSGINIEYAKKLVWGGLYGYDVFSKNLTTTEQIECKAIIDRETQNKSDAKGTKKCN